jgi:DNA mismatch repair protein MSH5
MAVAVHGNRCGVAWFDDGKVRWALATNLTHLFKACGRQQEPAEACKKAAGCRHRSLAALPSCSQLSCMEAEDDTTGPFRHQLLHLAKLHAQPAVIYVSSKADAGLVKVLRAPLAGAGAAPAAAASPAIAASEVAASGSGGSTAGAADAAGSFDVRLERSTLFLPRAARGMLEAVHVRGTPAGLSTREHLHRLNTMLSLSREQQVCAAGALLAVLAREGRLAPSPGAVGAAAAGPSSSAVPSCGTMELASISEVSLDGYLLVDPGSMAALQIFQEESHPAAAMGIGGCCLLPGCQAAAAYLTLPSPAASCSSAVA